MKRCSKCKVYKEKEKFWKDKSRKDGLHHWCKECQKECQRVKVADNHARYRLLNTDKEPNREGNKRCPGCEEEVPRVNWGTSPSAPDGLYGYCTDCRVVRRARQKGAIIPAAFTGASLRQMKKEKNYKCHFFEECGFIEKDGGTRLQLDHNHISNKLRGLVCSQHNKHDLAVYEKWFYKTQEEQEYIKNYFFNPPAKKFYTEKI